MTRYDVFNGDADGLCALHQLRLAEPQSNRLVTGLKRDIALLAAVHAEPGDTVTVLDLSLDRNRVALMALLERRVREPPRERRPWACARRRHDGSGRLSREPARAAGTRAERRRTVPPLSFGRRAQPRPAGIDRIERLEPFLEALGAAYAD